MNLNKLKTICMLLPVLLLATACTDLSDIDNVGQEQVTAVSGGVFILCEGNYNYGNSTLSYYNPAEKSVENGVFRRANDRRLGDTGQSILIKGDTAYIAIENSGIVWGVRTSDFKVVGQLEAKKETKITNPRYVHIVSPDKAYVTDLYSDYINIFNPRTFQWTGAIDVSQIRSNGYCSTEEMVQYGTEVFVNCWSYSNKILVIDTQSDAVSDMIELDSWQPKSIEMDCNGKLWVITDGGFSTGEESFSDNVPHIYRIDAASRSVELNMALPEDEANVQIALNGTADTLYMLNNDIYRFDVTVHSLPSEPFIYAPAGADGKRHKLYGIDVNPNNGDIYVCDAVDYSQSGYVYRYTDQGVLADKFRVGITPNHVAFAGGSAFIPGQGDVHDDPRQTHALVNRVYEYMPAPGHQVNGYTIYNRKNGIVVGPDADMQEACDSVLAHFQHQYMVSLGGQGGYVIAGWDHPVTNSGSFDIVIKGNPYGYQSEPGIIWVSRDANGNGMPDDEWFELKGSEYGTANETLNYEITYYKPTQPGQDIEWTDNMGGSGIIPYMPAWNTSDSYWQPYVPTQTDSLGREFHTFRGSRLKDTHTYDTSTGMSDEPPFDWGYADNLGSDYFKNDDFDLVYGALGYFCISNAVCADGSPANLPYINFIKIQTGQTGCTPNLGEISTEVYGIWDYHY